MALFQRLTVYENQRALKFDSGKFVGILEPGYYVLWGRQKGMPVDVGVASVLSGFEEAMTADGATLRYQAMLRFDVTDLELAYRSGLVSLNLGWKGLTSSTDVDQFYARSNFSRLVTAALSKLKLEEAIANAEVWREEVNVALVEILSAVGLRLVETQIFSLTISGNLRAAYGDLLKAQLEAKASMERARNEVALNRSLLNTARLVRENPGLMELRLLMQSQKPRINFVMSSSPADAAAAVEAEVAPSD
ncbi:MAG: SPFH domain-containing protein [Fimbriimonadaceae bacterium]